MIRRFKFDYDPENDSLFMYDPKSKSNSSIELDDLIIDFNSKKAVSGIEVLRASQFFKDMNLEGDAFHEGMLKEIKDCRVEIISKSSFFVIKFYLMFASQKQLATPIYVPTLRESSPAIA